MFCNRARNSALQLIAAVICSQDGHCFIPWDRWRAPPTVVTPLNSKSLAQFPEAGGIVPKAEVGCKSVEFGAVDGPEPAPELNSFTRSPSTS